MTLISECDLQDLVFVIISLDITENNMYVKPLAVMFSSI